MAPRRKARRRSPGTGASGRPSSLSRTKVERPATPKRVPRTVGVLKPAVARLRPKMMVSE
jgi:hypothetical protein